MRNLVPGFILEQYEQGLHSGRFPAVALFVDVSDFTATTNTLTEQGKEGAEVMANIMQAIFEPLVRCVYEHGGFVSSFAGDGFTALFPGERTQIRGLTAAARMRKYIIEHSTRTTPHGIFHFAIKIGMAEGDVDWGIVGGEDQALRAYYFGGKATEECANAERQAGENELVVNGPVKERLKSRVGVVALGEYWRIADIYTPLPPPKAVSQPNLAPELTAAFVPEAVLQENVRGEYRQVVTLFVYLQGLGSWEQLNAINREISELQHRYGGYLNTIDVDDLGCRLLLFWGMPVGFEDDLERALNFVLELSNRTDAALKAGVTYRLAYAGFVGGADLRQAHTCYGQGVNLAARLMRAAPWGSVWVDEQVAQRARQRFDLEMHGPLDFKGFEEQQPAHVLLGRREDVDRILPGLMIRRDQRLPGTDQELVGREKELARLEKFLQPALSGRFAGTMLIRGEAGMGKSRLVNELWQRSVSEHPSPQWFHCQPDRIGRRSLNPFRYFLRRYFNQTPTLSSEENLLQYHQKVDELVNRTSNAALQQRLERNRSYWGAVIDLHWTGSFHAQSQGQVRLTDTMEALKTLIVAECLYQPVVLHVEDGHRLDEDSLQFLRFLVRDVEDCPLAILLTARPGLETKALDIQGTFSLMELGALGQKGLVALADLVLGSVPSDHMVNLLLSRSGGNPFFAEQMLLYLREEGEIDNVNRYGRTASLLPFTVRALLTARLDRLLPAVKEVVQGAAVLGQEFDGQILTYMFQNDAQVVQHLQEAERAAIWVPVGQGRYRFRSTLLREAAYDMLLQARRRRLHLLAAKALEIMHAVDLPKSYRRLVYHYGRAQDEKKERNYAILAGEQAEAQFAHAQAADLFSRALALTDEEDRTACYHLLSKRERIHDLLGERKAQRQDLVALAELAEALDDVQKRAELVLRQAEYAEAIGDYPTALAASKRVIVLSAQISKAQQSQELAAAGHLQWGVSLLRQGEEKDAQAQLRQALTLSRELGDRRREGRVLANLGRLVELQGDYVGADSLFVQALDICREAGDLQGEGRALDCRGQVSLRQGDYAGARDQLEQALQISRRNGDRRAEGDALLSMGHALIGLGLFPRAAVAYQQAESIQQKVATPARAAESLAGLAHVSLVKGRLEEAQIKVDEALDLVEASTLDWTADPFRFYWTCYQILEASGDPRARGVLETAHDLLLERAARIGAEDQRHTFLSDDVIHREIMAIYQN